MSTFLFLKPDVIIPNSNMLFLSYTDFYYWLPLVT